MYLHSYVIFTWYLRGVGRAYRRTAGVSMSQLQKVSETPETGDSDSQSKDTTRRRLPLVRQGLMNELPMLTAVDTKLRKFSQQISRTKYQTGNRPK